MRALCNHIHARLRPLRRNQDGAVLMEVIFSTLVVALATAAVLKGVEGSVNTAANNRERSMAAQIAEQDQERMRSYKATSLDGYSETRTVTVRNIPYTVFSRTQWIYDSSGTKSCTSDTSQASYMKLMTTVTPQRKGPTVNATSLLTAANGTYSDDTGSLAVMIVDRSGNPRADIPVSISGGASLTDNTNESGCANFYYIPVGNYTVTPSAPGLVDRAGDASPTVTAGVVGGQSTLTTIELDIPVAIDVDFDTKVGTFAAQPAYAQRVRLASSGLASPGYLTQSLGSFPSTPNSFSFSSLFPFTGGYAAYGGGCDKNDPTEWVPSYTANTVAVTPGGGPYNVTARLPAIWIRVQRGGSNLAGADVRVTPTDSGCTGFSYPVQQTTSTSANPPVALPKPGYPWGNYTVCADSSVAVGSSNARKVTVNVANTAAGGTSQITINIPTSSGTSGNC